MKPLTRCVFAGSFDPLTLGHTDIINRALRIFDQVTVGVLYNPEKQTLFSVEERIALINEEYSKCPERVKVDTFSGLLVDFVRRSGTNVMIRGLRAISDYDYEAQMALTNKQLDPEIETFFLMTSESRSYISSSLVKQVARFGGKIDALVPKPVERELRAKFHKPA